MRGIGYKDALIGFCPNELSNTFPDTVHIVNPADPHKFDRVGLYFVSQLVTKGTDRAW